MSRQSRVLQGAYNYITYGYGIDGHGGIDLCAQDKDGNIFANQGRSGIVAHSAGTVVTAYTWNKVVTSGDTNSYGNFVKIRHSNGYYSLYAHLEDGSLKVKEGDTVQKGQKIGYMGSTGNSTGYHLHFEVHDDTDSRINPTPYIDSDFSNLNTSGQASYNNSDDSDASSSNSSSNSPTTYWSQTINEDDAQKKSVTITGSYLVFNGEYTPAQIQTSLNNYYNKAPNVIISRKNRLRKILNNAETNMGDSLYIKGGEI